MVRKQHGLQHDPVLRAKVLQSLKASPGTAIHVNGVCIYRGYEKHFVNQEEPRGKSPPVPNLSVRCVGFLLIAILLQEEIWMHKGVEDDHDLQGLVDCRDLR